MGHTSVSVLLRDVRRAGFEVEVHDGALRLSGPKDRSDIVAAVTANKAAIVDALTHPPGATLIYEERLRKGADWLSDCWGRVSDRFIDLARRPGSVSTSEENWARMSKAFSRNLHRWADLDEELRRVYPEYRGCPIGGCDQRYLSGSLPVRCLHCAS